ncbi:hypothetical protein HZC34_02895 [Candidatus Saganbacteria bacterium]|nr:hypothetical protein [Candidatus Saganbacteria bacterium]
MIGIIFATIREARPFLEKFGQNVEDIDQHPLLVEVSNENLVVCICGMGIERAANGTEALLENKKVGSIINAGIAGALNNNFNIGHVASVSKVVNRISNSYYIPCGADLWTALPAAVLVTSPEPVFDDTARIELSKIADIVDMEFAEIARVCRDHKIKFSAIKAISDLAGGGDRARLYKNIDRLSDIIGELLYLRLNAAVK